MPTSSSPEKAFLAELQSGLSVLLPQFVIRQRWFGGKARMIRSVEVSDIVPFQVGTLESYFILAKVTYASGPPETYDIPLVRVFDNSSRDPSWLRFRPHSSEEIILKDAVTDERFLASLLEAIANNVRLPGNSGRIQAVSTLALRSIWVPANAALTPALMNAEQSNSSIVYEKSLVLKIFRRVEEGRNPDLEIGAFLFEKSSFRNVPSLAGYLEYSDDAGHTTSLGILQGYVVNQGDAWQFTLQALAQYYGKMSQLGVLSEGEVPHAPLLTLCQRTIPDEATKRIGPYLDAAALLGRRTAELHLALASDTNDPEFAPQPFSEALQHALVNSGLQLLTANFSLLRRLKDGMPDYARQDADRILAREDDARRRFHSLAGTKNSAWVTRIHGDYHLGQVLFTGNDFVIVDFEGEPARPLEERRKKRSPLQDVAGMLRSFHYAAYAPLLQESNAEKMSQAKLEALDSWAQYWQILVSAMFLKSYLEVSRNAIFIPKSGEDLALLLDVYLLDKAVYELGYELNNRPSWVRIPLDGISQLLR